MRKDHSGGWKLKTALAGLAATLVAVLVILPATATATLPKPLGIYVDKYVVLQADQSGRNLASLTGNCTPSNNTPYRFSVTWGIPVKGNGRFKWSKENAVNTPDGGTLAQTSTVKVSGKFTSKTKVSGSYKLQKAGCKKIKFKAKLAKD